MCTKLSKLVLCLLVFGLSAGLAEGQIEFVKINFQEDDAETPEGYLPDWGLEFGDRGNGFSYGWTPEVTGSTRQRSGGADQRYDSLAQFADEGIEAIWEIGLPNGIYDLFIVCADVENSDQVHNLDVEGIVVPDPDGEDEIDEFNVTVPVFDGRLTIQQAEGAYNGKFAFIDIWLAIPPTVARAPSPEDEATDVPRDGIILEWTAGESAASHDVYFGEAFEDVNDATTNSDVFIGNQLGTVVALERLELGKTYYWRVDEVNAPPQQSTVFKGEIWQFTTEPVGYPIAGVTATASSSAAGQGPENTVNGSGLDDDDKHSITATNMWLSDFLGAQPTWIQYQFDKAYSLHELWVWNSNQTIEPSLGVGIMDVTIEYSQDGEAWTKLDDATFNPATGNPSYSANTTVDLKGVVAQFVKLTVQNNFKSILEQYGLSEVRFFNVPVRARAIEPSGGQTNVPVDVLLSWKAGREAAEHVVYFDTNEQAVEDGQNAVGTVSDVSLNPGALQLDEIYYWRVDEVNIAEPVSIWQGDVWSFTTQEFIVVDDFEDYDVDKPIWEYWLDGLGFGTPGEPGYNPGNGTGSAVGDDTSSSYMEEDIVSSGDKSMPVMYNNSVAGLSEIARSLDSQDWTASGVQSLVLYFHGSSGNTAGNLYVKINDERIDYPGDASNLTKPLWIQWTIDLATVQTSLVNVQTLVIGVDNGGAGTLYIDDIRLYKSAPAVGEMIWLEAESATTLGEMWLVPDDPTASGGKYIGSLGFDGNHLDEIPGVEWIATYDFNVAVGGEYTGMLLVQQNPSDSFWVRVPTASSQSDESLEGGWIENDIDTPEGEWAWNEVSAGDDAVIWTLSAGAHTLEIAKREGGVSLDAIVITEVAE